MATVYVETQSVRTSPVRVEPETTSPSSETFAVDYVLVLVPFFCVMIWAAASLLLAGFPKTTSKGRFDLKRAYRVPCRNCQFFSSNPYLRCAVHPSEALTDRAIDCADFCPPDQKGL